MTVVRSVSSEMQYDIHEHCDFQMAARRRRVTATLQHPAVAAAKEIGMQDGIGQCPALCSFLYIAVPDRMCI